MWLTTADTATLFGLAKTSSNVISRAAKAEQVEGKKVRTGAREIWLINTEDPNLKPIIDHEMGRLEKSEFWSNIRPRIKKEQQDLYKRLEEGYDFSSR